MCAPDSVAKINNGEGSVAGETDEQRKVREGLLALKRNPSVQAPDLADAGLKEYARSNLLKERNQGAGRKGSFNAAPEQSPFELERRRMVDLLNGKGD